MSLDKYIQNILDGGYDQGDESFYYDQVIVISKNGNFSPINIEITSDYIANPSGYNPETNGRNVFPDNNPSLVFEDLGDDPFSLNDLTKASFTLIPKSTSDINCDGAVSSVKMNVVHNQIWNVPCTSFQYEINGVVYNEDEISNNSFIAFAPDNFGNAIIHNISTDNVRLKFKALPENQDQFTIEFSDNDTAGVIGSDTVVCLSVSDEIISPIGCFGATNILEWNESYGLCDIQVDNVLYPAGVDGKEGLANFINSHPNLQNILYMNIFQDSGVNYYTLSNQDLEYHKVRLIWVDKQGHPNGGIGSISGDFLNPTAEGVTTDDGIWIDQVCLAPFSPPTIVGVN